MCWKPALLMIVIAACGFMPHSAKADVLFNQYHSPITGLSDAKISDNTYLGGTDYVADNFTLSQAANMTSVNARIGYFFGSNANVPTGSVLAALFQDNNGVPGNIIVSSSLVSASTEVTTGYQLSGSLSNDIYTINIPVTATLSANTRYWMAIIGVNVSGGNDNGNLGWIDWNGASAGNYALSTQSGTIGTYTSQTGANLQFQIMGSPAPEPASLSLLAMGGFMLVRRRRHA